MKKTITFALSFVLFLTQFLNAQERSARSSGNTSQQRSGVPNSSFRSNANSSSFAPSSPMQRQRVIPQTSDWRSMNMQEKKNVVNNMTTKERTVFLQKMKEDIVFEDLNISSSKEEEFKLLFDEYQKTQKEIREKFIINNNLDKLTDDEANKRLSQSFEVGQQLLDNRKEYAGKFLKILSPQQVLKLFQTEGKLREKVLDKKNSN